MGVRVDEWMSLSPARLLYCSPHSAKPLPTHLTWRSHSVKEKVPDTFSSPKQIVGSLLLQVEIIPSAINSA